MSDLGSAAYLPALKSDDYQPNLLSIPGLQDERKADEPCTIVIFGASGDLTARKLIPVLYHLFLEGQMPESFRVVGFACHVF